MPRSSLIPRWVSAFALASFTALDLILIAAALAYPDDLPGAAVFGIFLLAHALLSVLGGIVHLAVAPPQVQGSRRSCMLWGSLTHFFIPVIGFFGMAVALRYGLGDQRVELPAGWTTFAFEGEAHVRRGGARRRTVSPSEVEETLRSPHVGPDKRFQAVLQVRYLPMKQGISLLKLALKDSSDEVRLFAFSRLERFRNDLETKSRELTDTLAHADETSKSLLHLRLAEAYWEIAYLGLAEGAVRDHALKNARDNARTACELRPGTAPAEFLAGRIALLQKEYTAAQGSFDRAVQAGYARVKALPYMAECAFHQQRYDDVHTLLGEVAAAGREAVGFQSVVEFWQ